MEYSEKVMNLFKDPHNMGEMKNPDGVATVGNPVCGDQMRVFIRVKKNEKGEDILEDVKVLTFGCVAAIATSSVITDMVKGKTIEEAKKITMKQITKELGGLPEEKLHCSSLSTLGLKKAIEDWESKQKSKR